MIKLNEYWIIERVDMLQRSHDRVRSKHDTLADAQRGAEAAKTLTPNMLYIVHVDAQLPIIR